MINSIIIADDSQLLIIINEIKDDIMLYWATNEFDVLLTNIKDIINEITFTKIKIGFIPVELSLELENIGFNICYEYIEYWLNDIKSFKQKTSNNIKIIKNEDYNPSLEIFKKCSKYSRGFNYLSIQELIEFNSAKNSRIYAYYKKDKIIGLWLTRIYGFRSEKGGVVWIRLLAVDPQYHRMGIGASLILKAINWGIENNVKRSFLAVDIENPARKLYEKLGYKNPENRGEINMEYISYT